MSLRFDEIVCGDCVEIMRGMPSNSVPLTVTSPPYGLTRPRHAEHFRFEPIAQQLFRITMDGGVVVWVTRDQQKEYGESLDSFRQAQYFQLLGFKVQTLIMDRDCAGSPGCRYGEAVEYAFVLVKGDRPRVFNPQMQPTKNSGAVKNMRRRWPDGTVRGIETSIVGPERRKGAIWYIATGKHTAEEEWVRELNHAAIMPEGQAETFILSYTKEGDLVFDPMAGIATTCKMAIKHKRHYFGAEVDPEWHQHAVRRLEEYRTKLGRTGSK